MEEIQLLKSKYRYVSVKDSSMPHKYMPREIKELSEDINKIEIILSNNTDSEVNRMCDEMKYKLTTIKDYFVRKLENIPNKYYMEESEEEWVDANKPSGK